jgi:hypothetical protein
MLQNKVGGGKPKMRWFFGEKGWPSSSVLGKVAESDAERVKLVDDLQEYKTNKYIELIGWAGAAAGAGRGGARGRGARPWGRRWPAVRCRLPRPSPPPAARRSGAVKPRPGVLRLMDEARATGMKVAVCSAATKPSVVFTLANLLGEKRVQALDCFMAGGRGTERAAGGAPVPAHCAPGSSAAAAPP